VQALAAPSLSEEPLGPSVSPVWTPSVPVQALAAPSLSEEPLGPSTSPVWTPSVQVQALALAASLRLV